MVTQCESLCASQYDLSVSTFSPDGRVFQTDYAQKAVDNSGLVTGRCYQSRSFVPSTLHWAQTVSVAAQDGNRHPMQGRRRSGNAMRLDEPNSVSSELPLIVFTVCVSMPSLPPPPCAETSVRTGEGCREDDPVEDARRGLKQAHVRLGSPRRRGMHVTRHRQCMRARLYCAAAHGALISIEGMLIDSQAVAGVAADGRQVVNRGIGEAQQYKRCASALAQLPLISAASAVS